MTRRVLLSRVNLCLSVILSLITLESVASLFEQCNHIVDLKAGQKIYINSPYYPAQYPLGTSCRYTVHAPLDHEINFKCSVELNVPSTAPRCQSEVFYFNGEGNEILTESNYFCNTAKFERKSFLNRATISYMSQPLFKKKLLPAEEEEVDESFETNENITDSTTSIPELDLEDENFTNAFTYLTELLTKGYTTTRILASTTEATTSTTEEGEIPKSAWRKRIASSNSIGKFANNFRESKFTRRSSKIVNNDSNFSDPQYYGYIGNKGGGRFSCLVEVVEPPCECGWTTSLKIAGATGVAGINEFPSMAGVKTKRLNQIFCGAAIIHHRYLISAAHCFTAADTNRSDLIQVVVGENDLSTVLESVYTLTYEIETIIPHEQFLTTVRSLRNDIALLRTRLPIEWNRSVGPACLPFLSYKLPDSNTLRMPPLTGQKLDTAGWGTTSFSGPQSTLLLKTTLDVFPKDQCRRILRSVPQGVFCTFTPGRDTCQYDSGGALYMRSHRLFVVGIVSYGFACAAQNPSVNTRIASFTKWIQTKTPEVNYCIK